MYLLRLIQSGPREARKSILIVTSLACAANTALIALVNAVAQDAAHGGRIGLSMVLFYVAVFAFFYIAHRASLKEANRFVQERLGELRLRVVGKICEAPLRTLEQVGHGEIFAAVAHETNHLAQQLPIFVGAAQSVVLLGFFLLYIAFLSLPSFLVISVLTAVGLVVFWRRRLALNSAMTVVYSHEAAMLDSMANFTEGFQEIRLNADRNDSLYRHFVSVVDGLEDSVLSVSNRWVALLQFSNAFLYALVGIVVFLLPIFFHGATDAIYKIAAATIFCVAPVTAITAVSHLYARAEVGLGHVHRLEEKLDQEALVRAEADETPFGAPRRIEFEDVTFSYRDAEGAALFSVGPWNFSLNGGEVLFLTGGNGSGKSTAMKLICGLYRLDGGRILVDGVPVTDRNRQAFRECFTAIFPDFHLFDRLHGLGDVDPAAVQALIDRMELTEKVTYEDGRFSTLDLSTGQRKRLAMIAALLEDRPIYLFDEWAADQDSHFRDVFYTEILLDLKNRGKTVIAVTHDDRYWSACDRRIDMDLGMMTEVSGDDAPGAGD